MDDIRVEEKFYVGGQPKRLRHFLKDDPNPILVKEWYQNGQMMYELVINNKITEVKHQYEDGVVNTESKSEIVNISGILQSRNIFIKVYYPNGEIAEETISYNQPSYYDEKGNNISEKEYKSSVFYKNSNINIHPTFNTIIKNN